MYELEVLERVETIVKWILAITILIAVVVIVK